MLERYKDFMGIYLKFTWVFISICCPNSMCVSLFYSAVIYTVAHTLRIYFALSFFYVCEISFLFSCVTLPVMYI